MAEKDYFEKPLQEGFYSSKRTGELYIFYKDGEGNLLYDNAGIATHYCIEEDSEEVAELPNDLELMAFHPDTFIKGLRSKISWVITKLEKQLAQSEKSKIPAVFQQFKDEIVESQKNEPRNNPGAIWDY